MMLPAERQVACACDVRMQRPVLHDHTGWNIRVTACMHCGTVTATRSIVEEPRPHDVRCIGNEVIPLAPDALAWLARWPRVAGDVWRGGDGTFLPHDVRCATHQDLIDLEARAAQQPTPRIERLRAAGVPATSPPASLPTELAAFRQYQAALALPCEPAAREVMDVIARNPVTRSIVAQLLVSGADTDAAIAVALASSDPDLRQAAIMVSTRQPSLVGDAVVRTCDALLAVLTSEADDGATALVHAVGMLGARMTPVLPTLEALVTRIDRQREYYFHKTAVEAVNRLRNAR
jgi:hypothetical protein